MYIKFYVKKWAKMLTGKSISHVNQAVGDNYSFTNIKGYYNNLKEKVIKDDESVLIPKREIPTGDFIEFPIEIFQFGLASYDLYLKTNEDKYLEKFKACINWTLENVEENGGIKNFIYESPEEPYSAMAQGECASLLIRAYICFNDEQYLQLAKKVIDFMLIPRAQGGTADYVDDRVYLYEFTNRPLVFNGWIFAMFGLLDYAIVTKDVEYKQVLTNTINTFANDVKLMDNGYWSKYDNKDRIASPFYHKLHIALLTVLYEYTKSNEIKEVLDKFVLYQGKWFNRKKAFIVKAFQKIKEILH